MGVVADLADRHHGDEGRRRRWRRAPCWSCSTTPKDPYTQRAAGRRAAPGDRRAQRSPTTEGSQAKRRARGRPRLLLRERLDRLPQARPGACVPGGRGHQPRCPSPPPPDPGRDPGAGGGVGFGQDDPARAHPSGSLPIKEGQLTRRRPRTSSGSTRTSCDSRCAARRGIVFQDPGSVAEPAHGPIGQSIGEPLMLARASTGKETRQARVHGAPRAGGAAHETTATGTRTSCRAASASASASRAPSRSRRSCWSRTSPPARWTSRCRPRFLDLLLNLQERAAVRLLSFVSHDRAVVDILAHRIAVMHTG